MEQQYTCPECKKDYTRFTIHEHYACGVEPLDSNEVVISTEPNDGKEAVESVCKSIRNEANFIIDSIHEQFEKPEAYGKPVDITATVETIAPPVEPKKRGRKPKSV